MQRQADDEHVFQFLLGLNDSFAPVCNQILATDPLPSIGKVFSILFQEEQQRLLNLQPPSSETMVMATRTTSHPCPPLKCTACGKDDHTRDRCWTLIGYPPGREPRTNKLRPSLLGPPPSAANSVSLPPSLSANLVSLPSELYQKLLNLLAPSPAMIDPSPAPFAGNIFTPSNFTFNRHLHWIIDSGASHHICHHCNALADLQPFLTPHHIWLLSRQDIPAEGLGSYRLSPSLTLHNVSQSMKPIGVGDLCNGLYVYRPETPIIFAAQTTANKTLWHQRLGHPSSFTIPSIFNSQCDVSECDVCASF
ncbi:uncharacterized protein LOC122293821 [Carya illinoinensis]|uniref:uncharacterized protein LOC122293821 n=1 Tax=Carya illinoinensis TaxID=32201 RepID=UPI001C7254B8|nr:uncharacterized protein LOC122293821 [Carya illinoinensis]